MRNQESPQACTRQGTIFRDTSPRHARDVEPEIRRSRDGVAGDVSESEELWSWDRDYVRDGQTTNGHQICSSGVNGKPLALRLIRQT